MFSWGIKGNVGLKWDSNYFVLRFRFDFHDGRHYHVETSSLICRANQWTGFYMIGTSVMKELKKHFTISSHDKLFHMNY